jgi:UDP-glucose 4-epimerase
VTVRAVVTGGAGFIGSHLVDALVAEGADVLVIDDLSSGRLQNIAGALSRGVALNVEDVVDADLMRRLIGAFRPEVVFHLAAQIDVARAVANPLLDATVNILGTVAVLQAAGESGARRFLLASTGGAVYGDARTSPTRENAPVTPLSPYGASKAAAEGYLALYERRHELSALSLRLANVYGPRQGANGEGGVIARYCRARLNGRRAPVFGDGRQTRDFVYVGDVVAAFLAAAGTDASGAVNIGTGTETTVLDVLGRLALEPDFQPARSGEVRRSCLDAGDARRRLGWRPGTTLDDGLAQTLEYARSYHAEAS